MFDLICKNNVSSAGFLLAIQPAPLGNALSTMATMFEFTRRTNVATIYPGLIDTPARDICQSANDPLFTANGLGARIDLAAAAALSYEVSGWIGGGGAISGLSAALRQPGDLKGLADISHSIVTLAAPQTFTRMSDFQEGLAELCARGNGVLLTGAYWPQYMVEDGQISPSLRSKLQVTTDQSKSTGRQITPGILNIAIHMRRGGDYKRWFGGRYFFELDAYVSTMMSIAKLYPEVCFHIFTNETFYRADFPAALRVEVAPGATDVADFINLGLCDLIVGPPSTYATWAAYLGIAKRLILTPERIGDLAAGADYRAFLSVVERPTFSYAPGVDGPL